MLEERVNALNQIVATMQVASNVQNTMMNAMTTQMKTNILEIHALKKENEKLKKAFVSLSGKKE
jgi:hypothetical protein